MKKNKAHEFLMKYWWVIAGAIAGAIYYFRDEIKKLMQKGDTTSTGNNTTNTTGGADQNVNTSRDSITRGFAWAVQNYGEDEARWLEKAYRQETGNFTSGGFRKTGAAGMGATANAFPFGWKSLKTFTANNPDVTTWLSTATDNGSGAKQVAFDSAEHAIMFMAWFIHTVRQGYIGYWKSTDEIEAMKYVSDISDNSSAIVDALT